MELDALAHGLSRCRGCRMPVPGPVGLLNREIFHISRCPHCGTANPHPKELDEWMHARRTAIYGGAILLASLCALLFVPVERWL